jgi:hypothetical protein
VRPVAASLVFTPLDGARVRLLHATMPVSSYFVGRRAQRVAAIGVVSILFALLGTAVAPMWMLALGPIVLGVPHLLADLRYCVVRPAWHRQPAMWIGVGVPLLLVAVTGQTAVGFAAVAGACAASSGPRARRVMVMALAIGSAVACVWAGPRASLVLVHLHNLVAVLLWWRWRDGPARLRLLPVAAFVAGSLLIACGGLDLGLGLLAAGPLAGDLHRHMHSLAPGLDGVLGLRVVLLFCFAQSVHYVIWLRLVPEDDRARPTPRSFHARAELGLVSLHEGLDPLGRIGGDLGGRLRSRLLGPVDPEHGLGPREHRRPPPPTGVGDEQGRDEQGDPHQGLPDGLDHPRLKVPASPGPPRRRGTRIV